jgi:hypothetical protein
VPGSALGDGPSEAVQGNRGGFGAAAHPGVQGVDGASSVRVRVSRRRRCSRRSGWCGSTWGSPSGPAAGASAASPAPGSSRASRRWRRSWGPAGCRCAHRPVEGDAPDRGPGLGQDAVTGGRGLHLRLGEVGMDPDRFTAGITLACASRASRCSAMKLLTPDPGALLVTGVVTVRGGPGRRRRSSSRIAGRGLRETQRASRSLFDRQVQARRGLPRPCSAAWPVLASRTCGVGIRASGRSCHRPG